MNSVRPPTHSSLHLTPPAASWKRTIGLVLSLAALLGGCVSTGELPEHANIQGPLPQNVRFVAIQAMPMKPGTIRNVDKLTLTDAPPLFVGDLKDALALKQPSWQIKLASEGDATSDQDLIIATELLEIDGGSAALRFWIGLNTGAILSRVKVSILDKTGKDLANANISEHTACPVGACTDSTEAMVQRNLKNLAEDVAQFIADPAGYEKKMTSKPKS